MNTRASFDSDSRAREDEQVLRYPHQRPETASDDDELTVAANERKWGIFLRDRDADEDGIFDENFETGATTTLLLNAEPPGLVGPQTLVDIGQDFDFDISPTEKCQIAVILIFLNQGHHFIWGEQK